MSDLRQAPLAIKTLWAIIILGMIATPFLWYEMYKGEKNFEPEYATGKITNLYVSSYGSTTRSYYKVVLDRETTFVVSEDTFSRLMLGDYVTLESTYYGKWELSVRVSIG